jgi:hypothetical protein
MGGSAVRGSEGRCQAGDSRPHPGRRCAADRGNAANGEQGARGARREQPEAGVVRPAPSQHRRTGVPTPSRVPTDLARAIARLRWGDDVERAGVQPVRPRTTTRHRLPPAWTHPRATVPRNASPAESVATQIRRSRQTRSTRARRQRGTRSRPGGPDRSAHRPTRGPRPSHDELQRASPRSRDSTMSPRCAALATTQRFAANTTRLPTQQRPVRGIFVCRDPGVIGSCLTWLSVDEALRVWGAAMVVSQ